MNKLLETIHDMMEIITGKRPNREEPEYTNVDKGFTKDEVKAWKQYAKKPKRARGKKGKFKADDKSTAYTNEAWVGGKAPTRVKTVGYKKRKKNVKS